MRVSGSRALVILAAVLSVNIGSRSNSKRTRAREGEGKEEDVDYADITINYAHDEHIMPRIRSFQNFNALLVSDFVALMWLILTLSTICPVIALNQRTTRW